METTLNATLSILQNRASGRRITSDPQKESDKSMKKRIIFIPDISGYSRFVKETEITEGASITASLLRTLIATNNLSLRISEIEGDSILFYRYGNVYSLKKLLRQFNDMFVSFNEQKKKLAIRNPGVNNLSLKAVVHYGDIEEFSVNGFNKIYGSTVVEAHRLLKNSLELDSYLLISDAYEKQLEVTQNAPTYAFSGKVCECYDVGNICYTFFSDMDMQVAKN